MTYFHIKPLTLATVAGMAMLLGACTMGGSNPQDTGTRISARGDSIAGRGAEWTEGQRDLQKGQRLVSQSDSRAADAEKRLQRAHDAVAKAERQIEVARADRSSGERMIAGGSARMQQAEAAYESIRSSPSAITPR